MFDSDLLWVLFLIVAGIGGAIKRATEQGRRTPQRGAWKPPSPPGHPARPGPSAAPQESLAAPEVAVVEPPVQPVRTSTPAWKRMALPTEEGSDGDGAEEPAPNLAAWLQDPRTVQQAVVASEILGRPRALRGQRFR